MKVKIILLLLVLPLSLFSQTKKVSNLPNIENRWLTLSKDWYYQKGDNLEWAKPEFDDSSWQMMTSMNLNMPDSTSVVARDNEIAWFRKYIKLDSLKSNNIILNIHQQGASEIYLDGKLIKKFGIVSTNPDEVKTHNPRGAFLSLPLEKGKEHMLAVRYVNAQYKYPNNRRYQNTNGYIRLDATSLSHSKKARALTITDSIITDYWDYIGKYWRYQKGDNINWSKPDFDDSSWRQFSSTNLNRHDSKSITEANEIVWYRRPIKADSTFNDAFVFTVYQSGASEIYLDGVLINKVGEISSNKDKAKAKNGGNNLYSLPLKRNKEHMLAIRFQNIQPEYPTYRDKTGFFALPMTTLNNAITNGNLASEELVFKNEKRERLVRNLYTALGIGLIMFILFLSLFLFFPRERINGYFALATFFFCVFICSLIFDLSSSVYVFKYDYATGLFTSLYIISTLYCIYKIFNQALGYMFWSIIALCTLNLVALFYISSVYLGPLLATIVLFESIRISFINRKKEKIGALIFIFSGILNLIYWFLTLLDKLTSIRVSNIDNYQGYAYCIMIISIAIYLGYKFGKRSQILRLKLAEVQTLSKEKETILSEQNETLEKQVKERTAKLNQSLEELKATQSQLIQSEKMASLGELTAGIAHEIQNPLNFVNNFSEVSNELVDEMKEELDNGDIEEAKAISVDIKQNLEKINHHGKRADSIVKGMLQHSRSGSSQKEPTDINKLADEYFRLAYHGLRAKDKNFNATLETDFDKTIGLINVIPQDIGRVVLNLITNAFYAVDEKQKTLIEQGDMRYKPIVSVATKKESKFVSIAVKDNGDGIPKSALKKIFEPFYTTKPTGKGTGLGLSMSYDIVSKGHGGKLKVESDKGKGTIFIIELPQ